MGPHPPILIVLLPLYFCITQGLVQGGLIVLGSRELKSTFLALSNSRLAGTQHYHPLCSHNSVSGNVVNIVSLVL